MTFGSMTDDSGEFRKEEFRLKVEDLTLLPAISPHVRDVLARLDDPGASVAVIAGLIEKDPGLSARILKVANSPLYASRGQVTRVMDALVRVGLMTGKGILLTTSFFDVIREHPAIVALWKHSMAVSIGARKIGEATGMGRLDEIHLAGLLHDIGKIVYLMFARGSFDGYLSDDSPEPDFLKESRTFGMDHAELGTRLAEAWHFPPVIHHVIRYHHVPEDAPEFSRTAVKAVGLADRIASAYGLGHFEDPYVESGIGHLIENLGVASSIDGILASILEYGDNTG